jgi:osmoprotectant transport system permease protein
MPMLLLGTLVILYVVVKRAELSSGEQLVLTTENVLDALAVHMKVTLISTVLVLLIAIPLGVLLTRSFARRSRRRPSRCSTSARRCRQWV